MPEAEVGGAGRPWWERLVLGLLGVGAFVTALGLMKQGAASLIPTLEGSVFTDNAWSALGVGWLGACIVLSGSPVAASSLTLLDGGAINRSESFAMLTGSRLGASFVVLVVGVIYALRRDAGRRAPLSIGVYALSITAVAYLPGAAFGWWLLTQGHLDGIDLAASPGVVSVTDELFGWLPDLLRDVVPGWSLFPIGVVILLGAFACFDRVLPTRRLRPLQLVPAHQPVGDVRARAAWWRSSRCRCPSPSPCSCRWWPTATSSGRTRSPTSRAPTSRRWPTRSWPPSSSATPTRCAWCWRR